MFNEAHAFGVLAPAIMAYSLHDPHFWISRFVQDVMDTMQIATATWASPDHVESRYEYRDGSVWLGRSPQESDLPLGYRDDRHVCLISGSRGGKGTSVIVNNLCLWPGSVVVVDPKGENATVTASRRGGGSPYCDGMGQAVHVLDPFRSSQVDESYRSRFNPLDALDPEDDETIDEAGRIADALVVVRPESHDPFWDESARALVKALILHVVTSPKYAGRRNLATVRSLITSGDAEAVEFLRSEGAESIAPPHQLLWASVQNNPAFDGLVSALGHTFFNMLMNSAKQYESVLQTANRNTDFIDSPGMRRCLEESDFSLAELKTDPRGMSLYLCLPQRYMSTHYRWLRMMIALTVTEMEIVPGRPASGCRVLMVLDEFAGLKRMEIIENAVAQIAGFGVKMFFVLQSLEQLKGTYKDHWETFLANSGLKICFNLEDHFSREYVSKLIGETEIIRHTHSESQGTTETEGKTITTTITKGRSVTHTDSETFGHTTSENLTNTRSGGESVTSGWSQGESSSVSHKRESIFDMLFGRDYSKDTITQGLNVGQSGSRTQQDGWSVAVGQGQSDSITKGNSVAHGETHSESIAEGNTTTKGKTSTSGRSETIQKRALIHPDEIGRIFASINDPQTPGYPGAALVLVAGERPVILRRVNYFDDYQFIRLFDPHPDHPYRAPGIFALRPVPCPYRLEPSEDEMWVDFNALSDAGALRVSEWAMAPTQVLRAGTPVGEARLRDDSGKETKWHPAFILSPFAGRLVAVEAEDEQNRAKEGGFVLPRGPVYSMLTYDVSAESTAALQEGAARYAFHHVTALYARLEAERALRPVPQALPRPASRDYPWWFWAAAMAAIFIFGIVAMLRLGGPQDKSEYHSAEPSEPQTQGLDLRQAWTPPARESSEPVAPVSPENTGGANSAQALPVGDVDALRRRAVEVYIATLGTGDDGGAWDMFVQAWRQGDPLAHIWLGHESDRLEKLEQTINGSVGAAQVIRLNSASSVGKLADWDNPEAVYLSGFAYERGFGRLFINAESAASYYEKSCTDRFMLACYALGRLYVRGSGVSKDAQKAAAFLKQACDAKIYNACVELGRLYESGGETLAMDYALAGVLYKAACDANRKEGCVRLKAVCDLVSVSACQ